MQTIAQFISPFYIPPTSLAPLHKKTPLANDKAHSKMRVAVHTSVSFRSKVNLVIEKVKQATFYILTALISAALYWINPSLFAIGFIAGIIMDAHTKVAIEKITDVWKRQKVTVTLFGSVACGLSLPATLATAAVLWSANLGSLWSAETQRKLKGHPALGETSQKPLVSETR